MNKRKYSVMVRMAALLLAAILVLPMNSMAAAAETVQPRASDYLESYSAYVYPAGWGKIRVYFNVTGAGNIEVIGALSIQIYESTDNENWTWKKTFTHEDNPGMLSYNDNYHSGSVEYSGVIGRYYKAYVCIWGGGTQTGDARYFYTSPKKATLFAA